MVGMNTTLIVAIAVIAVLVIAALIVIGLKRKQAKTVSFEHKTAEPKQLTQHEKSGNYQAQGGFNFAPAKKEAEVLPGQELKPQPTVDLPETTTASDIHTEVAEPTPAPATADKDNAVLVEEIGEPDVPVVEVVDTDADTGTITVTETVTQTPKAAPTPLHESKPASETTPAPKPEPEPVTPGAEKPEPEPTPEPVEPANNNEEAEEALEAATAAATIAEAAEQALEEVAAPEPSSEPAPDTTTAAADIDPAAGRIGRLRGRLARSQNVFGKSVLGMLTAGDLDEDAWEDIEAQLIQADLGVKITMNVVEDLRDMIAERGVSSEAEARAMLRECLIKACKPELDRSIKAMPYEGKPAVVLMVGVNGTGKTTTTGKLARVLVSMGHKVLLGAADTFRAAAADQLEAWGKRVGADVVRGAEGADPAAVAFDAVAKGIDTGADVVVVDTAGRLHNSANLMDQLGKVKRVVEKKTEVDEVLLVLDATTGQNGLTQAKVFGEVVQITGVVLTKLDGTAKGGIVFQVQEDLGVPVKLVGLGEGADDLAPFEVEGFIDALLG